MRVRILIVAFVLALLGGLSAPVWAWWSDSAGVTASLSAATLQTPTGLVCSGNGVTWTAPATGPAPAQYDVNYVGTGLGSQSGVTTVSATSWMIPATLLSLGASYRITAASRLYNWTSPYTATSRTITVALGLLGVAITTCS